MFNIPIGFTEPQADKAFIQLVQQIMKTGHQTIRGLAFTNEAIVIAFLTKNNLKDFVRDLKLRSFVKEPQITLDYCNSCGSDRSKKISNFLPHYEESEHKGFIVFDISKINRNIGLIKSLSKLLKNSGYAILFLNPMCEEFNHLILKYDGSGTSIISIQTFSRLFPSSAKNAESATMISPLAFKKSQIAIEKKFVKSTSLHYANLGFIKLPLNTVMDFFSYSSKYKADLLILSQSDLMEILDMVTEKGFNNFFMRHNISVFAGFE